MPALLAILASRRPLTAIRVLCQPPSTLWLVDLKHPTDVVTFAD